MCQYDCLEFLSMVSGGMAGGNDIIVVDDDASVGQAIERLLIAAGWLARTFQTAEDFIGSAYYGISELLILDIQLPGITGPELHQRMTSAGMNVSVIYITGHDHLFLRTQAEAAGALAYFTKPFPGEQLIAAIGRHRH